MVNMTPQLGKWPKQHEYSAHQSTKTVLMLARSGIEAEKLSPNVGDGADWSWTQIPDSVRIRCYSYAVAHVDIGLRWYIFIKNHNESALGVTSSY